MKARNDRCPLQAECERKCKHEGKELECDYYHANARPGYEIADQEEKRYAGTPQNWSGVDTDDLDDLDDDEDVVEEVETEGRIHGLRANIPVSQLVPHPDNPRKELGDLTELAASIEAKGLLQNLMVVPEGDVYRVIIGHRRLEAAKMAGLDKVPCVIVDMTPQEQFETMMIENVQRSDLTVYEQAEGFQMMLDMGGTVEKVSQKTGFSETTVRNRVKLLKLDKKEFQKAEQRGATLTDYLKLNDIEDPSLRNKVLKTIGTADFKQQHKAAISAEKDRKWLQQTIATLRKAEWCEELTPQQRDERKETIQYKYNYGPWKKRDVVKPEDADEAKWFFVVGSLQVDMYREVTKSEAAIESESETRANQREQARKEVADKIDELLAECEEKDQDFRNLREDFINSFDKWNTYREEIQAFAVKAWLFRDVQSYQQSAKIDREELAGFLNIEYDPTTRKMDEKGLENRLRVQPEQVLLTMAYLLLEDGNRHWTIRMYDNTVKCALPKHREDKQLELLYECLRSLGYDWSTEEQRACIGALHQYDAAERLVREFQEEGKKNE